MARTETPVDRDQFIQGKNNCQKNASTKTLASASPQKAVKKGTEVVERDSRETRNERQK